MANDHPFVTGAGRDRRKWFSLALLVMALLARQSADVRAADVKPYDERLFRLTEILGAVHYLRELCGGNDGQMWRDRVRELTEAEGSSALRRARLTARFNQGYTSFSRTYKTCTPSAQTTVSRFMAEGAQISEALIRSLP